MNTQTIIIYGILLFLVVVFAVMMYRFHKDPSKFDIRDFFVDPATGKASTSRLGIVTALVTTTWSLVYLVLNDKLTEWFYVGYLGTWVLGYLGSKAVPSTVKKDEGQ